MSNQLVKKNPAEGYQNVFPKTWIDAIKDKESGVSLQEILQGFNMYFLSYNGSRALTRCKVPLILRKEGLWITYVLYDHTVVTEWYNSDQIDDNSWSMDSNWRIASNNLVGDISVSSDGYWVINGEKTEAKAQGEQGVTPLLRVGDNGKLQASYNAGKAWKDISDYIVPRFRWNQGAGTTAGTIQISMDLGKTWTNLSNEITNNLRISRYIGTNESLPTSGVAEGTIYMKGPYYDEGDTSHANPIYRMWIYAWKGNTLAWQDNGEFTTISAGVVQERGTSTTKVMSQDAVTRELTKLEEEASQLGQKVNMVVEGEMSNIKNTIAGTSYTNKIFYKFKAEDTLKISCIGDTSLIGTYLVIRDSNGVEYGSLPVNTTKNITISNDCDYVEVFRDAVQVIGSGPLTLIIDITNYHFTPISEIQQNVKELLPLIPKVDDLSHCYRTINLKSGSISIYKAYFVPGHKYKVYVPKTSWNAESVASASVLLSIDKYYNNTNIGNIYLVRKSTGFPIASVIDIDALDGVDWYQFNFNGDDGENVYLAIEDITEIQKVENELNEIDGYKKEYTDVLETGSGWYSKNLAIDIPANMDCTLLISSTTAVLSDTFLCALYNNGVEVQSITNNLLNIKKAFVSDGDANILNVMINKSIITTGGEITISLTHSNKVTELFKLSNESIKRVDWRSDWENYALKDNGDIFFKSSKDAATPVFSCEGKTLKMKIFAGITVRLFAYDKSKAFVRKESISSSTFEKVCFYTIQEPNIKIQLISTNDILVNNISQYFECELLEADCNKEVLIDNTIVNRSVAISDTWKYLSGDGSFLGIDETTGICYALYNTGTQGYGESKEILVLSTFPINNPYDRKDYEVLKINTQYGDYNFSFFQDANMLVLDDVVRVFFDGRKTGETDKTWYYIDFDKLTHQVTLPIAVKFIVPGGSTELELNRVNYVQYLSDNDYTFDEYVYPTMSANFAEHNNRQYTIITTQRPSLSTPANPVVAYTTDNGATLQFVNIVPIGCDCEAQIAFANGNMYLEFRQSASGTQAGLVISTDDGQTFNTIDYWRIGTTRPQMRNIGNNVLIASTLEYWMNNQYDAIRATSPTRYIDRYGIILRVGSGQDMNNYKEVIRIYNPDGLLYYWLLQYNGVWYMTYCGGGLFGNNKAQVRFVKIGEITEDGQFKLN